MVSLSLFIYTFSFIVLQDTKALYDITWNTANDPLAMLTVSLDLCWNNVSFPLIK